MPHTISVVISTGNSRFLMNGTSGSSGAMQVHFDPPRLALAGGIDLAIGRCSQVELTSTYITPHVRMGRGGRGSLFVFTKGGDADRAGDKESRLDVWRTLM